MAQRAEYCFDKERERQIIGRVPAHHRMPDGKLIAMVDVCFTCGHMFAPERGRKWCPRCRGLLINKTIVLRIP